MAWCYENTDEFERHMYCKQFQDVRLSLSVFDKLMKTCGVMSRHYEETPTEHQWKFFVLICAILETL